MPPSIDPTPPEVMRAFIEYLKRQNSLSFPSGALNNGIWIPDPQEYLECCPNPPTPDGYEHCKGVKHCALYFGADPQEVQKLVDIYIGKEEQDAKRHKKSENTYGLRSHKVWLSEIRHQIARR